MLKQRIKTERWSSIWGTLKRGLNSDQGSKRLSEVVTIALDQEDE